MSLIYHQLKQHKKNVHQLKQHHTNVHIVVGLWYIENLTRTIRMSLRGMASLMVSEKYGLGQWYCTREWYMLTLGSPIPGMMISCHSHTHTHMHTHTHTNKIKTDTTLFHT